MATIEEFEQAVIDQVIAGLHCRFRDYERRGVAVTDLGDPDQLASRMLAAMPAAHPWYEQFGEFWSNSS
ncbi:hypothetical protein [Rhodococcus sp. NPDC049939]|uniref:hypothetical protein n=1 Tax=Rhodococcus sp. NPDC049939 TaxID=3155511 RepID=UPI0033C694ED